MKNASSTYYLPIILSNVLKEDDKWDIMQFINNTYLFNGKEDVSVVILNKKSSINGKDIDGKIIDRFIESKIFKEYEIDEETITFYFNNSKKMTKTRTMLLNGKFSKIPQEDKCKILNFLFKYDNDNLNVYTKVSGILRQDKILKKNILKDFGIKEDELPENIELRSKIDLEKETYKTDYAKRK